MSPMVRSLAKIAVLWALLAVSAPAPGLAQTPPEGHPPTSPGAALEEAMRRILGIIDLLIQAVPQYEPPEMLDNGDIIIRRKRPGENRDDVVPTEEGPDPEKPTRTRI